METEGLLAEAAIQKEEIGFCGMGVPGTVDAAAGLVLSAPNLNWHKEPCAALFEEYFGMRPSLVQDSRAGALGEYLCGAGRGSQLLICIALGTGIGCGVVYQGEIFHGALGGAGETGHIPMVTNGRLCGCGQRGCLETYAAGRGIAQSAREHPDFPEDIDSPQVFEMAEAGDPQARKIIAEAAELLSRALTGVVNVLSPDCLLFSGGMSRQKALFVDPIIAYIRSHAYQLSVGEGFRTGIAELGEDAPMIGAAMQRR